MESKTIEQAIKVIREELKKHGGTQLFERDYHSHNKPESLSLFRVDFEEDKKDEFVLKKLKNMFDGGISQ